MKKRLLLCLSVFLLVISLILITTGIASGNGGSQTWYLHSTWHTEVGHTFLMEKGVSQTYGDSVWIESGSDRGWLSDTTAETDVTFPSGQWELNFPTFADWTENLTLLVGEWDTDISDFTVFSTELVSKTCIDNVINVKLNATGTGTVHEDNYLAFAIYNEDGATGYVYTGPDAWFKSPDTDPGFPLPEVATGILLALGIGGLGTFIAIRRKRTKLAK